MSEARTTSVTDADRLLAEPVFIEHPAGRQVGLLFTVRTMVEVERHFGSMGDFEDELNLVLKKRSRAPILTFVVRALDALLYDDPPGVKENRVDCLEMKQLGGHVDAILEAWERFWPDPKAEATAAQEGVDPNSDGAESAGSPGHAGTTSESSVSDLAPIASGG